MKRKRFMSFALVLIIGTSIVNFNFIMSSNRKRENTRVNEIKDSWCWPFLSEGKFEKEQKFGYSDFRQGNFHSGLDFGNEKNPGKEVHCIKSGKVIYSGNPEIEGLGPIITVINDGKYNFVYQEFATNESSSLVKKGDFVKTGQVIGVRDTDLLHIGVTEVEWTKALESTFKNDGVWMDPLPLIQDGVGKSENKSYLDQEVSSQ